MTCVGCGIPGLGSQSEILENLWVFLVARQHVMAGGTVLGNGFALAAGVLLVMAAEATIKIHMPDVVRVGAPCDLHRRKNITLKNCEQFLPCGVHIIFMLRIDIRIGGSIVILKGGWNTAG